jgi:Methyladenine glycosylase
MRSPLRAAGQLQRFDPERVAAMTPAQIAATGNDARVARNKAKIQATVENAREVRAVLDSYGSIRAYLASFPDVHAASADMRRRFEFLGNTGLWRLLTSAARASAADSAAAGDLRDPPTGFRPRAVPARSCHAVACRSGARRHGQGGAERFSLRSSAGAGSRPPAAAART